MTVLITTHIPELPGEVYDRIVSGLTESLRTADGFIAHAAVADSDGVTVTEIWDDASDWQSFFDTHVKAHLPTDLPRPEAIELRNAILR